LAQAAGRRVARIDENLVAARLLGLIQALEIGAIDQNLAAHLQHGGRIALEFQGHGAHGPDIAGDVLAHLPVAASGGLGQQAMLIAQIDGQAIELELDGILDQLVGPQQPGIAQRIGNPFVECEHIVFGKAVAQRTHGPRMAHAFQRRQGRPPDALRRGLGHDQFRILAFDGLQAQHQPVVFSVGHLGGVLHVV